MVAPRPPLNAYPSHTRAKSQKKSGKKQSRGDKMKELRGVNFFKSNIHHLKYSIQYPIFKFQNIAWASGPDHPKPYSEAPEFGKLRTQWSGRWMDVLPIPPQRTQYPRWGYPAFIPDRLCSPHVALLMACDIPRPGLDHTTLCLWILPFTTQPPERSKCIF